MHRDPLSFDEDSREPLSVLYLLHRRTSPRLSQRHKIWIQESASSPPLSERATALRSPPKQPLLPIGPSARIPAIITSDARGRASDVAIAAHPILQSHCLLPLHPCRLRLVSFKPAGDPAALTLEEQTCSCTSSRHTTIDP